MHDECRGKPRTRHRENPGSSRPRRANYLPARAFSGRILLPHRRRGPFQPGGAGARAHNGEACASRQSKKSRARRLAFRAPRGRGLPQQLRRVGCRREPSWEISQDAHSRRSVLLRKILFHAWGLRLSEFRYKVRAHRCADLLGPVVSRRLASHCAWRRSGDFLSHQHRLAPA